MKISQALGYMPVMHAGIRPDGSMVHVVIPKTEQDSGERTLRLLVLALAHGAVWQQVGADDASFHAPSWSPDSRRLAVFRKHAAGQDIAVFDRDDWAKPPTTLAGMPTGCVALKWWGTPGWPMCVGLDESGCRRVYAWHALDAPPVPVTPARRRVADYAVVPGTERLAWLYGPPRPVGQPLPETTLYVMTSLRDEPVPLEVPEPLLGFLSWSPDGRWLAAMARPRGEPLTAPRLWILDPEEGKHRRVLADITGWITGYDWVGETPQLVVAVDEGVQGRIYRVTPDGEAAPWGETDTYYSGVHGDRASGRMVVMRQNGHEPQHVRLVEPGAAESLRLSRFNRRLLSRPLRPQQTVTWVAPDGLELEGLLMRPESEGPHKMVVWLHGGPAEHLQRTFSAYFQVLCHAGYAVFAPNYRGSTGRGDAFIQALVGDLCGADVGDIESGVRALIRQGVAHRRQVGIVGWSYGGSLALCVAAEHAWVRAVVAGAPVADWLTVFGARTWPHVTRAYFEGEPWETPEAYDKASPVRRIGTMRSPTLLLHGEEDDRVPVTQSRLLYRMLAARGTPTDLRVFPGEGHVFSAPWAVQEMLVRTLAWFDQHLQEED